MGTVKYINSQGAELELTNSVPFLLQKFDINQNVNIYSSKSMNQDGSTYLGNILDIKDIPLEVALIATSEEELIEYTDRIYKVFNPKLGQGYLIYKDEVKERKVKCIVNKIPYFSIISNIASSCLISLTANDPFWQDCNESKVSVALWRGGFNFPLKLPTIMGYREPSLLVNVVNKGDTQTGMIIEFYARGALSNPSLFNINTREYIKINKTLVGGEKITINTNFGKKKIIQELNGVTTDVLNYIDLEGGGDTFLQLDLGDNIFRYDADNNLNNLECSIYYNNNYLGV